MSGHFDAIREAIAERNAIAEDRAHLASLMWAFRDDPEKLHALVSNNFSTIRNALLDVPASSVAP